MKLNQNPHLNKESRWQQYEQIFNSFFAFKKKRGHFFASTSAAPRPEEEEEGEEEAVSEPTTHFTNLFADQDPELVEEVIMPIYKTLPKSVKEKGFLIMKFLTEIPEVKDQSMQISRAGHLVVKGKEHPESNLLDLIHFAVRKKRKIPIPAHWTLFLKILRKNSVPMELLALHHKRKISLENSPPTRAVRNRQPNLVGALRRNHPGISKEDRWWISSS